MYDLYCSPLFWLHFALKLSIIIQTTGRDLRCQLSALRDVYTKRSRTRAERIIRNLNQPDNRVLCLLGLQHITWGTEAVRQDCSKVTLLYTINLIWLYVKHFFLCVLWKFCEWEPDLSSEMELQSFCSFRRETLSPHFSVFPCNSHPFNSYAAERVLTVYVADTWQPLIRPLLVAECGDKTTVEDGCWTAWKSFVIIVFTVHLSHWFILDLHNKEARWAISLFPFFFMCVHILHSDIAWESLSLSSWHWRKAISGSVFAFDSDITSQRLLTRRNLLLGYMTYEIIKC